MELTTEHMEILKHAEEHSLFCGDSPEIRDLHKLKMIEFAGWRPFVPDLYYRITADGKSALADLQELAKDQEHRT